MAHITAGLHVCVWLLAATASAQDEKGSRPASPQAEVDRTEEAKGLFAAGRAAFDAGRFADALDYFQRSYTISGHPGLLYNIGIAHDRLRDDARALEAYEAYLTAVPDADNRATVETRAAAIRAALARRSQDAAPMAPTPAQTAAAAPMTHSSSPEATGSETDAMKERDDSIFTRWWFWTAVGAVVLSGVTVGIVAASGGDDKLESPAAPNSGVIVTTLGASR